MVRSNLTEWARLPDYTVATTPSDHSAEIKQDGNSVTVMLADILAMQETFPPEDDIPPGRTLWVSTARGVEYRLGARQALDENGQQQVRVEIRNERGGDTVTVLLPELPEIADQCPQPPATPSRQATSQTPPTAEAQ